MGSILEGCGGGDESNAIERPDAGYPEGEAEAEAPVEEGEAEAEAESESETEAAAAVPPTQFQSVTIEGALQSLTAGENGCYAVTNRPGYFDVDAGESVLPSARVYEIQDNGAVTELAELPEVVQRSYGSGIRSQSGVLGVTYQSTAGWQGQDGTHHGVVVLSSPGELAADHDLHAIGLTRPGTVLERGGSWIVVGNDGSATLGADQVASFGAVAVTVISDPAEEGSASEPVSYSGFTNGAAAAMGDSNLHIAAIGDGYHLASAITSDLLVVDPDSLKLIEVREGLVRGVGMNGAAPIENGQILFTGAAADRSGRAINLVNVEEGTVSTVTLPGEIATTEYGGGAFQGSQPTFVQGAVFVDGGGFLLNINQRSSDGDVSADGNPVMQTQTYFYDSNSGEFARLSTVDAQYPIAPVEYGEGKFCSGANGTVVDEATGNVNSEVMFWSVE